MAFSFRNMLVFVCSCLILVVSVSCTMNSLGTGLLKCGEGFQQTSKGCVPNENVCSPACGVDQKCESGKCVERDPDNNQRELKCSVTCNPGEICQKGQCVATPCKEACKGCEQEG